MLFPINISICQCVNTESPNDLAVCSQTLNVALVIFIILGCLVNANKRRSFTYIIKIYEKQIPKCVWEMISN